MIHFAADKLLHAKHAPTALPLALVGLPFALPELADAEAAGLPGTEITPFRQEDAVPGTDLPAPDPALLALFSQPQPPLQPQVQSQPDELAVATPHALAVATPEAVAVATPDAAVLPALHGKAPPEATPALTATGCMIAPSPDPVSAAPVEIATPATPVPFAAPQPRSPSQSQPQQQLQPRSQSLSLPGTTTLIDIAAAPPLAATPVPLAIPSPEGAPVAPRADVVLAPAATVKPAPLHFTISADLAATVSQMVRAGSPLVSPTAALTEPASQPLPAPVPLPAHWHVAPKIAAVPEPTETPAIASITVAPLSSAPKRDDRGVPTTVITATAAPEPTAFAPVAEPPTIDLGQDQWPTDMIVQIERLRDAADEVDTRIRLLPDALGEVQVEVRQEGDMLWVRFNAEQPQTRALLQDAQPRLADAAEARGLKLGQSSVDSGTHGQQRQPAPAPQRASTNPVADRQDPADDARIA